MKQFFEAKVGRLEAKVEQQEFFLTALRSGRRSFIDDVEMEVTSGKNAVGRTCRELLAADPSLTSGMYSIDPDGQDIGDGPIYVYCDMTNGKHHKIRYAIPYKELYIFKERHKSL